MTPANYSRDRLESLTPNIFLLSKDVDDPAMKNTQLWLRPEVYFSQGLTKEQKARLQASEVSSE